MLFVERDDAAARGLSEESHQGRSAAAQVRNTSRRHHQRESLAV